MVATVGAVPHEREISVIVPLHRYNSVARRCLEALVGLPGGLHETLVVTDQPLHDRLPEGATALTTGSTTDTSPAEKRDFALEQASGRICAFIDDDAWPADSWWLERALERFADPAIAALGGPGVTPPGAPLSERLGGAFYESRLGSGGLRHRFVPEGGPRDVHDWPAYNFFVRTGILRDVGGWASRFYGGEDTKLCLSLIEAGHRIVYDPDVVVYHKRRPLFRPHMRQVANVGRHRGWFVHEYPLTSARPIFFAPSAALVAFPLIALWGVRHARRRRRLGVAGALGWGGVTALAVRDGQDRATAALLPVALAAGHGAYGAGFLRGLLFTSRIEAM